jgi:hypothetical protein
MTLQFSPEALQQIREVVHDVVQEVVHAVVHAVVDPRFEALERELRDGINENRRQFGVLHEALTSKVELVIEGFNGHNQRCDRLEGEMHGGFAQVDRRLTSISARLPRLRPARPPKRPRRRRDS